MSFPELHRLERGHRFHPTAEERLSMPPLYATEDIALDDKIVWAHFFTMGGRGDWWLMELDHEDDTYLRAFGMARITDLEPGYFDLTDLESLLIQHDGRPPTIIERDLHWTPRPWREVER